MRLLTDLLLAATTTLALGIGSILAEDFWGGRGSPWILLPILASVLAGVAVIAKRQRARVIPIASAYVIVMLGVLLYAALVIDWHRGRIDQ